MWRIRIGIPVFRKKFYTHKHLDRLEYKFDFVKKNTKVMNVQSSMTIFYLFIRDIK